MMLKYGLVLLLFVALAQSSNHSSEAIETKTQQFKRQMQLQNMLLLLSHGSSKNSSEDLTYNNAPEFVKKRGGEKLQENAIQALGNQSSDKKSVDSNAIHFKVYTRKGQFNLQLDQPVPSEFNTTKDVKMYIHDHSENSRDADSVVLAYMTRDLNLIIVDWSEYAFTESTFTSKFIVPDVGKVIAHMIMKLNESGVQTEQVHLIGFGYGAHIAGLAGKNMIKHKINRISGLDPYGPGFNLQPSSNRLDEHDAEFVDTITTSGHFAMNKTVAPTSFYPNGGVQQPGCRQDSYTCNHRVALDLWVSSINSNQGMWSLRCQSWINFTSEKCENDIWAIMGDHTPSTQMYAPRGKFYSKTNSIS